VKGRQNNAHPANHFLTDSLMQTMNVYVSKDTLTKVMMHVSSAVTNAINAAMLKPNVQHAIPIYPNVG
jgi:hypothetical protein